MGATSRKCTKMEWENRREVPHVGEAGICSPTEMRGPLGLAPSGIYHRPSVPLRFEIKGTATKRT